MTAQKLKKSAIITALASIAVVALLFLIHYFTYIEELIYLEYFVIFIGLALNLIAMWRIINHANKHKRNRSPLFASMALNIVAIILFVAVFRHITGLLDTLRINLINSSAYELKEVKLSGCQIARFDAIKPGDSKMVAIKVNRNCQILVAYLENGALKNKILSAFVTESMGQELTFEIGGN